MATYITTADVFRVSGLPTDGSVVSSADITSFIGEAIDYFQKVIYGTFIYQASDASDAASITETLDGTGSRKQDLGYFPITSITTLAINGVSVTPSTLIVRKTTGIIELGDTSEYGIFDDTKPQLVVVTYKYGELVSDRVKNYTALIAAQKALIAQLGGTWASPTSFSLPELSGSVPSYQSVRTALDVVNAQLQSQGQFTRVKPQFG